nr:unnamed protein product [Callosobruchus analis]
MFSIADERTIMGGDFNAHHHMWVSYKRNPYGNTFVEALGDVELILLNKGSPIRLSNPGRNSVVDLILSAPALANEMSWKTHDNTLGSDHFPIILELDRQPGFTHNVRHPKTKCNTAKADWNSYRSQAEIYFSGPKSILKDIEEKYQHLLNGISTAANGSISVSRSYKWAKKKPPPPWWDKQCDELSKRRKEQLQTYKQTSSLENYILCKKEMARTKKMLKIEVSLDAILQ